MLSFGWVTQEQIRGTMKVNNLLTKAIKEYLLKKGYEQFQDKEISSKNCLYHSGTKQYIIVYTRSKSGQGWAPYEYVKKLVESHKKVILLLGILENDSLQGKIYKLNNGEIVKVLEKQRLSRGQHYSIGESQIQERTRGLLFENQKELNECLEDIIKDKGV